MKVQRKSYALSLHLVGLVLAAMIPFFIFAGILVSWLVNNERVDSEQQLSRSARDLAISLDRELESTIKTLQAIAANDELKRKDMRAFHHEMLDILKTQPNWLTIVLHSRDLKLILSALKPFEERMSLPVEPKSLEELFATGLPTIGTLAKGSSEASFPGRLAFPVRVPIYDKGKVAYSLTAIVSPESMQNLITTSPPGATEEWTRTVIDKNGFIVARSRNPDDYVGSPAPGFFLDLVKTSPMGLARSPSIDGEPIYFSYYQSPLSGWIVAVGLPIKTFEAQTRKASIILSAFGLLLIVTFGGIALNYSRKLARKIRGAAAGASLLARGQTPIIEPSRVSEVEQLGKNLVAAAELIQQKERDLKQSLSRAQSAQLEAEKANLAKSEFLANMNHELRTPLGVILGILDLLGDQKISATEKQDLIERMQGNAEYLSSLIDQILDLSKIEAGALQIEVKPFQPKNLLKDLDAFFEVRSKKKGISLVFDNRGHIPDLAFNDALRIRQILINVISNAIKFTSRGEVKVTTRMTGKDDKSYLEFTVSDTGIGMNTEQQQRLFKPFSQADSSMSRRFGGTGIGLVLSKKVAQALGGDMELIRSDIGQGSVFRITVPDKKLASYKMQKTLQQKLEQPLTGKNILLVDDSSDIRFVMQHYLTLAGANVVEASDGITGVEAALKGKYDVVLMDIQMPGMDGNEATHALRKQGYDKPIIAVTAHAMKTDKEEALRSGFTNYITKPIDKARLIEVLASL